MLQLHSIELLIVVNLMLQLHSIELLIESNGKRFCKNLECLECNHKFPSLNQITILIQFYISWESVRACACPCVRVCVVSVIVRGWANEWSYLPSQLLHQGLQFAEEVIALMEEGQVGVHEGQHLQGKNQCQYEHLPEDPGTRTVQKVPVRRAFTDLRISDLLLDCRTLI